MADAKLLDGIKVVDLGVGMGPALAAKYLADAGASVTRIETPGDPFGTYYPAYEVWHRGAARADAGRLDALLADADACIVGGEDWPGLVRQGDAADIAARFPHVVVLDLTGGPAGTPYAGKPTTELLAQVRSGLVWEQRPDRPIVNAFDPATYGAALQGLVGLLAALYEKEGSGQGQVVTASLFEGTLAWIGIYWAKLEKPTPLADYVIPRGVWPLIFKGSDGAFFHMAIGSAGSKYGFYQALRIDDPTVTPESPSMPQPGAEAKNFFGDWDLLAEHAAKRPTQDVLEAIWQRGLPAEQVMEPGDIWDDPQIQRNGIIVKDADGTRHVGLPFMYRTHPAGAPKKPAANVRRPLDGVKVVDCGAFVAGPLAAVLLADLGAEVIKVEAMQGDPNRAIFKGFSVANRGKKGLMIDLKDPEGNRIVRQLCREADVVMNNFRPGVSPRLGVDPKTLHADKPELIVMEAPAYGTEGPLALKAGFDMVMQAWAGHERKAAGAGNDPYWNRTNLVDFCAAMVGAVAMVSGLLHRARTGNGLSMESPLINAGIYSLSELIQTPDGRFTGVPTLSGSLQGYHPSEALYQAKDSWLAIVARGTAAQGVLAGGLGLSGVLSEEAIAAAVATKTVQEVIDLFAGTDVWVEKAREDMEQAILTDPVLIDQGVVRAVAHPQFGVVNEVGALFAFSRSERGNDRAAPLKGEATREILTAQGYDAATIAELAEKKVVLAV